MNIKDKTTRKELLSRYLEASTSVDEERLLAEYYTRYRADEDEVAIARLILVERIDASFLSETNEEAFERINQKLKQKSKRLIPKWTVWAGGIAASISLLLLLNTAPKEQQEDKTFTPIEIAQNIQEIMNLEIEDVLYITATPVGDCILMEAGLTNGSTKSFVMKKGQGTGETSLLAIY